MTFNFSKKIKHAICYATLTVTFSGYAESKMTDEESVFLVKINQLLSNEEASAYAIKQSIFPDLYEVDLTNGSTIIVDKNGQYGVVSGRSSAQVYNFSKGKSLTNNRKGLNTREYVSSNDPLLTYKAKREEAEIYIFADIQCGYCQMLHDSIPELNASGITVHYYPVAMYENSDLFMNAAYCSENPERKYTEFTNGIRNVKVNASEMAKAQGGSREDYDRFVADGMSKAIKVASDIFNDKECTKYDMENAGYHARGLGITGTPHILFSNGKRVEGALSVNQIQSKIFK